MLEANANKPGEARLNDVYFICARTDPQAKVLKHLPGTLKKYFWKALETILLSDAVSKVARKRQADVDAGLLPDDASNADGGSKIGGGNPATPARPKTRERATSQSSL